MTQLSNRPIFKFILNLAGALLFFGMTFQLQAQSRALIREYGKFGYINTEGRRVIRAQFDNARPFSEGVAAVEKDSRWGYIDAEGTWVIPPKFYEARNFNSGIAMVKWEGQWRYIDKAGTVLPVPSLDKYYDFQKCGVAFYRSEGRVGLIDTEGAVVLPPTYDVIKSYVNGHARVVLNDKWGMIDASGAEVIPPEFEELGNYSAHAVTAKKNGHYGLFVNGGFKPLDGIEYIWDFNEEIPLTYAQWQDKVGFINPAGAWVIEPIFEKARPFRQGLAPVYKNRRWGYIDPEGNIIIDFKFKDAETFSEDGLAAVRRKKKWGFINLKGEEVTPFQYEIAPAYSFLLLRRYSGFINGVARVKFNDRWGFINTNGGTLGNSWYDNAKLFSE